jgi:hypothetical protein
LSLKEEQEKTKDIDNSGGPGKNICPGSPPNGEQTCECPHKFNKTEGIRSNFKNYKFYA